jgi:hypothetical protein
VTNEAMEHRPGAEKERPPLHDGGMLAVEVGDV